MTLIHLTQKINNSVATAKINWAQMATINVIYKMFGSFCLNGTGQEVPVYNFAWVFGVK